MFTMVSSQGCNTFHSLELLESWFFLTLERSHLLAGVPFWKRKLLQDILYESVGSPKVNPGCVLNGRSVSKGNRGEQWKGEGGPWRD